MSERTRTAPPQQQVRPAAASAEARPAPPPASPSVQKAAPSIPGATPENLTFVPQLASGDPASIGFDWEAAAIATNTSYGCVVTTPAREAVSVTLAQGMYRRSFDGEGVVRVAPVPPAPDGSEGSLTARNVVTGASVVYQWRWQSKSAAGGGSAAPPKRGLFGRLFGAQKTATSMKSRTAQRVMTVAERLGNRAHLAAPVKFFGVETIGQRFAFVVDKSGSMEGRRWVACLRQLEAALWSLPDSGQFAVVLFNESALTSGNNDWQRADVATIEKELAWVKKMCPGGGTLPTPAFEHVFRMPSPPDVIFFLTDGDLGGFGPEQLAQLRGAAHTVVNAIAMESPGMAEALKALADESGGQFAAIADASVEAAK